MSFKNIQLGRRGEDLAYKFLKNKRYRILHRNYKTKMGQIDIIGFDKDSVCFIEVKTRSSDKFGPPELSITASKERKLSQLALSFIKRYKLTDYPARFDVLSIIIDSKGQKSFKLIKDAFELTPPYSD